MPDTVVERTIFISTLLVKTSRRQGLNFACPFQGNYKIISELSVSAECRPVSGRAVDERGNGWRTVEAVHVCSHYPTGFGEVYDQSLLCLCRNIVDAANAMGGLVGARWSTWVDAGR